MVRLDQMLGELRTFHLAGALPNPEPNEFHQTCYRQLVDVCQQAGDPSFQFLVRLLTQDLKILNYASSVLEQRIGQQIPDLNKAANRLPLEQRVDIFGRKKVLISEPFVHAAYLGLVQQAQEQVLDQMTSQTDELDLEVTSFLAAVDTHGPEYALTYLRDVGPSPLANAVRFASLAHLKDEFEKDASTGNYRFIEPHRNRFILPLVFAASLSLVVLPLGALLWVASSPDDFITPTSQRAAVIEALGGSVDHAFPSDVPKRRSDQAFFEQETITYLARLGIVAQDLDTVLQSEFKQGTYEITPRELRVFVEGRVLSAHDESFLGPKVNGLRERGAVLNVGAYVVRKGEPSLERFVEEIIKGAKRKRSETQRMLNVVTNHQVGYEPFNGKHVKDPAAVLLGQSGNCSEKVAAYASLLVQRDTDYRILYYVEGGKVVHVNIAVADRFKSTRKYKRRYSFKDQGKRFFIAEPTRKRFKLGRTRMKRTKRDIVYMQRPGETPHVYKTGEFLGTLPMGKR